MKLRIAKKLVSRGGCWNAKALTRVLRVRERFACIDAADYAPCDVPDLCFRPRRLKGGHIHAHGLRALGVEP